MTEADEIRNTQVDATPSFPSIHRVDASHILRWLTLAASDLKRDPLPGLCYGMSFALLGWLITTIFGRAYEYFAALMSGSLLIGPILSMGLYEISRHHEEGKSCSVRESLMGWRRNISNIGIFAAVLGILFLIWARASLVIFALFYTQEMPSLAGFLTHVFSIENIEFLAVYFGIGLLFATLVFALSVVSMPLMLDRNQDAVTAMIASVIALFKSPATLLLWALIISTLTIIGFATLHLGLIVIVPLIGHASWHAYRDIVPPQQPA